MPIFWPGLLNLKLIFHLLKHYFRFGMAHPTRCLGLVLIHPTSTTAGVLEQFKVNIFQKISQLKIMLF